jgi:hypothetical protein
MSSLQQEIIEIVDRHALKAQQSQYDRRVTISAVAAVRQVVMSIFTALPQSNYNREVIDQLSALLSDYYDPDGEYTSGKGTVGDLVYEIKCYLEPKGL